MRKFLLLLLTSICFTLIGCGITYEDTNGEDDFSLQTITDENIVNLELGSSGLKYSKQSIGNLIFTSEYSSKNFNGVAELYSTDFLLPSDISVDIGYLNVTSGNFKLAVINNNEIIQEIPINTFNETFSFEDLKGSFAVHIVGESAAFELSIQIN